MVATGFYENMLCAKYNTHPQIKQLFEKNFGVMHKNQLKKYRKRPVKNKKLSDPHGTKINSHEKPLSLTFFMAIIFA